MGPPSTAPRRADSNGDAVPGYGPPFYVNPYILKFCEIRYPQKKDIVVCRNSWPPGQVSRVSESADVSGQVS